MTRAQIWQKFPKLLRFMALFPLLRRMILRTHFHCEAPRSSSYIGSLGGPLRMRVQSWSRRRSTSAASIAFLFCWGVPGVLRKRAPRAMGAMRGKTLEAVPFQPYFGCTESFLKVVSNQYCQATRAMRAKLVVTVPLQPYFGFH